MNYRSMIFHSLPFAPVAVAEQWLMQKFTNYLILRAAMPLQGLPICSTNHIYRLLPRQRLPIFDMILISDR